MNALEAKARQARFAALVEGDPIGRLGVVPQSAFDTVLAGRQSVNADELAQALGGIDRNRVEHHLLSRGYAASENEAGVFERRPWYLMPWPSAADHQEFATTAVIGTPPARGSRA